MSNNASNRPTHNLVRFYGDGKGAPRATMGAVWQGEDGRMTIIINSLTEQIRLTAFPADQDNGGA